MVLIKTEFIPDEKKDQHAAGKTDDKADNVDKGINFLFFDVSEHEFDIIFQHISLHSSYFLCNKHAIVSYPEKNGEL